ncbi:hypothetical protein AAF712_007344 [Marasmius tenuissimus]|uniref:Uncharacterized protein n=1 Tax=Marasmius tenuissimus TaxID=585030 RepID=A0ABR2ZY28_9AGAR
MLVPYSGMFESTLYSIELHLEGEDRTGGQGDDTDGVSVFHAASKLRNLSIATGSPMPARRILQSFPLHQITTLILMARNPFSTRPTYENLQTILSSLVNIEVCSIKSFNFVYEPAEPRLTFARLHRLELATVKPSAIDAFLDSVNLPALRRLTITPQSSISFIQFLKRSSCSIEHLSLGHATTDVLIELLKAKELQAVKYLVMAGPGGNNRGYFSMKSVSDDVLRILMSHPSGEILLPHLQRLSLISTDRYSDTVLVDLLVSRRDISQFAPGTASPLRHARICPRPQGFAAGDEAVKSKLRELIDGGLLVTDNLKDQAVVV